MEEIKKEMQRLITKWKGKPEAPQMSDEWIDRRFDRMKYRDLREKLNILQSGEKQKTIFEAANEVFKGEVKK